MGYYDKVKDDVREQNSSEGSSSNFSTLKENAGEVEKEEDDTPIEVLEDGGLKDQESADTVEKQVETDSSAVEEKLDRIIEQNDRMIEILESFGS